MSETVSARAARIARMRWRRHHYLTHHPKQRAAHILADIAVVMGAFSLTAELFNSAPGFRVLPLISFTFAVSVKVGVGRVSRWMRAHEVRQAEARDGIGG